MFIKRQRSRFPAPRPPLQPLHRLRGALGGRLESRRRGAGGKRPTSRERRQGPAAGDKAQPAERPARPGAPNRPAEAGARPERRRSARPGPPGLPSRGRGPDPPPSRFPPNLETARPGTKREGAPATAEGRGCRRPSGLAGTPRRSPSPSPQPLLFPGPPSSQHKFSPVPIPPGPAPSEPAQRSPLTGRRGPPEPPPPPGLGPSRQPPPHVPRVAIAFAATLASPPPPPLGPPPPPQSPAEAKAAPAAARTRGEAPAHYAPRWGRGRPAAAWERGRAARGARVGGGVPERAGVARAPNFPRSGPRSLPGGPGRVAGACGAHPRGVCIWDGADLSGPSRPSGWIPRTGAPGRQGLPWSGRLTARRGRALTWVCGAGLTSPGAVRALGQGLGPVARRMLMPLSRFC